jgi:hypothetical protein
MKISSLEDTFTSFVGFDVCMLPIQICCWLCHLTMDDFALTHEWCFFVVRKV